MFSSTGQIFRRLVDWFFLGLILGGVGICFFPDSLLADTTTTSTTTTSTTTTTETTTTINATTTTTTTITTETTTPTTMTTSTMTTTTSTMTTAETTTTTTTTPPVISVSINPAAAALESTQSQQFNATVTGDTNGLGVTWAVDGSLGGNASVGAISSSGLYTAPSSPGTHIVTATSVADTNKSASASITVYLPGVYTYHNNLARDGTNAQENILTPANVNATTFGKLFSCPVDGAVYAQPLWVPSFSISEGIHNVIFTATEHDSIYAFDADSSPCVQLWRVDLLDSSHGVTTAAEVPVPATDVGCGGCGEAAILPEIGVTGTPVIDPASNTLYVVSKSEGPPGAFHQRLHALDLATGDEKFSGPVDITASVSGIGDGSFDGIVPFNPQTQLQRSALTLVNGVVYIAWASHEDVGPYHGWVIGYSASTLSQVAVYNANPNGYEAGIWEAGDGLAADSSGDLYFSTGNGTFDGNSSTAPNNDFGDTVLKLSTSGGLAVADWFTPFNQIELNEYDIDLGSGGTVLLPDQTSGPAHLLVTGGKEGRLYLLNRDAMGGYCASCTTTDTNILQSFTAGSDYSTPAFWQNGLYFAGLSTPLMRFAFNPSSGTFDTSPSSQSSNTFSFPTATPSISSQGSSNGIAWVIDSSQYGVTSSYGQGPAVLHAYDATNLANELWNSGQATENRDQAGNAVKFTVPTVVNGKVYIGTQNEIDVYGINIASTTTTTTTTTPTSTTSTTSITTATTTSTTTTTIPVMNLPPSADILTPVNISTVPSAAQSFTAVYSDPDGYQNISDASLSLSGGTQNESLHYSPATNKFTLMGASGDCSPGQAATLSDGNLTLDCGASSASGSGTVLLIIYNLTPQPPLSGAPYLLIITATDQAGASNSKTTGFWIVNRPPSADSVSPMDGTTAVGTAQAFTAVYSDPDGWQNIATANSYLSGNGGVHNEWLHYLVAPNLFTMLGSDDFCSPGQAKTLTSGYLILDCGASSVSGSGNTLTVIFNVTPQPPSSGIQYNIFSAASDQAGAAFAIIAGTWGIQ
jgi:hypothetical protein